ncbi:leucyl aminopeptidase family protein [Alphaproteobacteria bacterium]|nr:leucyl aminopeptidase family protein [Alphaproteobacteria bacterium]
MLYSFDKSLLGFCKNRKIKSLPLYIFGDLKKLDSTDLINIEQKRFLKSAFDFKKDSFGFFPNVEGVLSGAVAIIKASKEPKESIIDHAAKLSKKLPNKKWAINFVSIFEENDKYNFFLGWGLSFYSFSIKGKKEGLTKSQTLCLNKGKKVISNILLEKCFAEIRGIFLTRDLINLPPNILTPYNYEKIIKNSLKEFSPKITSYKDNQLEKNFPLVNIVGRSSENKPALIDMQWSKIKKNKFPNITLIGKGVTFDSGGLDLKPSNSMLLMKKDMGGSAIVLGIAYALMSINCPVNLRVILPLAENSVSEKSMRPLDVVLSRNKTPIEIGNTDAEGRLLLADALTFSQESKTKNDFIINFATLTGAARVALGTELPALFSNNENLGNNIINEGIEQIDPMWKLPLFKPYEKQLKKNYDVLSSTGSTGTGGAITAALFLKKFVDEKTSWAHVDLMAWNTSSRPGFPIGGEAMGLRNIVNMILKYCHKNQAKF